MDITRDHIEDVISRLEYGDMDAISEAEDLIRHATSDDWKDKFVEELYVLGKTLERLDG